MIAAATAAVCLLPTQTDDALSVEDAGSYILSGGIYGPYGSDNNYTNNDISAIVTRINNDNSPNATFTITLTGDVSAFPGYVVYYNKIITMTSLPDEQFKITFANAKGITLYNGGRLTLENIILDGGNYGGGTSVSSGSELILNSGAVIQNCTNSGVSVDSNGKLTMNSGAIIQKNIAYLGGGVSLNGLFTMNDGAVIQNCTATSGGAGGVYIGSTGKFTMESGAVIQNCSSGANGGGVFVSGTFIMNGGAISGNYFSNSGCNGAGVLNVGTFTMNGGEITGNTATSWGGGVYSNKTFTMTGGVISGNTATNLGGGLYNAGSNTFIMSDGVISNNKAPMGGGIYSTGILNITSGTISGNTATSKGTLGSGGGIYTTNFDRTKVGLENGTVIFSGNTAPTMRTKDIAAGADLDANKTADVDDYANNIGSVVLDAVVLDALVGPLKNAPAYNNNDINYSSDTFAVLINIVPEGSGTVNVVIGTNQPITFTESGYVYVPSTTPTITLLQTPTPGSEYLFIDYTIDGKSVIYIQTITKSTTITAVYALPNYTISVGSDSGTVINPMWDVKVPYKEDQTFTFSAKPGYNLTAVYVDGVLLSSEEMASGVYTFTEVDKSHSIKVVSDVKTGSGGGSGGTGSGPGNGTGTEPGGGTGTVPGDGNGTGPGDGTGDGTGTGTGDGTGTGPGDGTGAGGNDGTGTGPTDGTGTGTGDGTGTGGNDGTGTGPTDGTGTGSIGSGNGSTGSNPGSDGSGDVGSGGSSDGTAGSDSTENGKWSVQSLICAVIAVFAGVIALIAGRDRFRTDDEEKRSKTGIILRVLALIIGIVSLILFFLTEDWSMIPAATDTGTPLMLILMFATLVLAMVSFRFDKADT